MRAPLVAVAVAVAVASLLIGCGGGASDDRDAGVLDASAPGAVSVRVVSGVQPASGIHIVFQNADGSLAATAVSGPGGLAIFELEAGGMVTVAPPSARLSTFTGVQPGDTLTFDVTPRGNPAGVAQITLPGPIGAANRFQVFTGCGQQKVSDPNATLALSIDTTCVSPDGQMAAVAIAFQVDEANPVEPVLAFSGLTALRDQPVAGGATFTLPDWDPTPPRFTLDVSTPIPPRIAVVAGEFIDEVPFGRGFITAFPPAAFPISATAADGFTYAITFDQGSDAEFVRASFDFARFAATEPDQSYDFAADPLPAVTDVSINATDPRRPTLSYESTATEADLWVAAANYPFEGAIIAWDVIAPAGASVTLPELPVFLEDRWSPPSAAVITRSAFVFELSDLTSYDEVRTGFGFSVYGSGRPPLAGPGSRVRASFASGPAPALPARLPAGSTPNWPLLPVR